MNLSDPRNIILTIPEGFDFSLKEYEELTGCKVDPIEIPLASVDDLIKIVTKEASKRSVPVKVISWNSPLLFEKKIRGVDGEFINERFTVMALRIKGSLKNDSVKRVICNKLHLARDGSSDRSS